MPNNKSPRKKHQPRRVIIPMMRATQDAVALDVYAAVAVFLDDPSRETSYRLGRYLAILGGCIDYQSRDTIQNRRDADAIAVKSMLFTLQAVEDRVDRTKVWHVSDAEAVSIRTAAGKLDQSLRTIPFNIYKEAEARVDQMLILPA